MSGFPGLEAKILKTLEEEGEMRPPAGRIGQEYFWQAASMLQAKGLAVADQQAGVVRKVDRFAGNGQLCEICFAPRTLHSPAGDRCPAGPADGPSEPYGDFPGGLCCQRSVGGVCHEHRRPAAVPVDDLRARCTLLVQRWRQAGGERGRCAVDLEEVLEESR